MGIKIEMRLLKYFAPIAAFSWLQKDEELPKFQIYLSWIPVYSDAVDLMSLKGFESARRREYSGFQRNSVFGNVDD